MAGRAFEAPQHPAHRHHLTLALALSLTRYLEGLESESLKISVWKGDVQLNNLQLKPEALQDLDLPITVKGGLLGKLTLKVGCVLGVGGGGPYGCDG